jgi:iron complex transport system permease protein
MQTVQMTSQQVVKSLLTSRQAYLPKFIFLILTLGLTCLISLNIGAIQINVFKELFTNQTSALTHTLIWNIRMPRLLMTLATGAGLALCGTVLQAICRNPLADPGLVGVSSAAALFAAVAIALLSVTQVNEDLALYFVPISAFVGSILCLGLLIKIADSETGMNTLMLILSGVAINAGAMALLGIVQFVVDDATLRQIAFWSMGSYAGSNYLAFSVVLLPLILGTRYFWSIRQPLMLMSCSEKQAKYQGVDTQKIRIISLCVVAAVIAACVSFSGIVSFVGLVVPHVCRMLIGSNLRYLLPASMLMGALLVAFADTVARVIVAPAEIPVGLVTSLIGVPFFIYLIMREKKRLKHV